MIFSGKPHLTICLRTLDKSSKGLRQSYKSNCIAPPKESAKLRQSAINLYKPNVKQSCTSLKGQLGVLVPSCGTLQSHFSGTLYASIAFDFVTSPKEKDAAALHCKLQPEKAIVWQNLQRMQLKSSRLLLSIHIQTIALLLRLCCTRLPVNY